MKKIVLLCFLLVGLAVQSVEASSVTYVDVRGSAVRITDFGGTLFSIELANFGAAAVVPTDVLTGVFFDGITFNPLELAAFTGASASLAGNTTTGCNPLPPGGPCPSGSTLNVGGEYAGEQVALGPYDYGISSSGLGLFGGPNFNGPNWADPLAVDGLQFGLVSVINGISAAANAGVTGVPLVRGVITFTLSGPQGFNPFASLTGVVFNYGTELNLVPGDRLPPGVPTPFDVPGGTAVPEPTSLFLLGAGLTVAATRLRKRK
jgi:hypothetical protein